jgi:S1-C subfamily serine protease
MSVRSTFLSSLALFTAFAAGIGVTRMTSHESDLSAATKPTIAGRFEPQARTGSASQLPDLSSVAERAIQASVNISSTQLVRVDPMVQFFRGGNGFQSETSLGSGMIVSADGYVLTNSHVVGTRNAEIHVTLGDNRELPASVVGIDPDTDLAVLKVDARGIEPLPWGDSSKLRVAEWVLAVGDPFALNQTVTLGIVSAQNRHDPELAIYNDFIQHDAAINPGNSGGALVSARGELVGINTLISSNTGGYQGVSFAIPSNLAFRIMNALIKDHEVVRGSIGDLQFATLTAEQAQRYGLGARGGVFIGHAPTSGPGLLFKDKVVSFNKTAVTERNQLLRLIAEAPIGSTATVEVIRSGTSLILQLPIVKQTRPQAPGR